ncbi:MAG: FapA family protein [Tepidisphaeraceae bacterium]
MTPTQIYDGGSYRIEIGEGGLVATLSVCSGVEVSAAAVINKLQEIGIADFDGAALIQALQSSGGGASLVVARGVAPVNERPGRVEYRVPIAEVQTGLVAKVMAGQVIATLGLPQPGVDGKDVFGKPIAHDKAPVLRLGHGVSLKKQDVTATQSGNARLTQGAIGVYPLLELAHSDDAKADAVIADGDVLIKGSVRDGRQIQTSGCLMVGGTIEAAVFKAGGWAHVHGGVVGRDRGAGAVQGDLHCRFASGARLSVGGDLCVQTEIAGSRIACGGRLLVMRGPICGGEATANGGIECQSLGNAIGTPTLVEAGIDPALRGTLDDIRPLVDSNRRRIAEVRGRIAPMMQNLKLLTPQQKEKATELLFEADELEAATEGKLAGLAARCRAAAERSRAQIVVHDSLHAGVTVRFAGVEALITSSIKGPVRLLPRRSGNTVEVLVEEAGGATFALPSTVVADHLSPFIKQITAEKKAA